MNASAAGNPTTQQVPSKVVGGSLEESHGSRDASQRGTAGSHRLGRELLWIGLGQAGAVSGAIVGIRILTGLLSPQAYGRLALGMTAVTLVNHVLIGPLKNGVVRFFAPACQAGALDSYLAAVRRLLIGATGGFCLVVSVACVVGAATGHANWVGFGLIASCFALLLGYSTLLDAVQNAARQRTVVALHQALASWGRFLLAAGVVLWLGASSTAALTGYLLAMPIVLASQWVFFRRTLSRTRCVSRQASGPESRWGEGILKYGWPFATFGIFTWMYMASDRWTLQIFATMEEVGVYAALYQLGYYPVAIAAGLMMQLVAPVFFERAGDASDGERLQRVHRANRWLFCGTLLLVLVATVIVGRLHRPLFRLLVAPEYRGVSWLLPGMVLAAGLYAAGQFASLSLMSETRTARLLCPKVVTALCGVGLNILGAKYYGVTGIVGANVTFSALYFIWMYLIVTRRWKARTAP